MAEHNTPYNLHPVTIAGATGEEVGFEGIDGPLVVVTANGINGLETEVVDVRQAAPDAFPPRHIETRTVTDQASFIGELGARPLITTGGNVRSTVWANRNRGTITAIYDDAPADATAPYADRGDRLVLQFVRNPDWQRFQAAASGEYHEQEKFGDLVESAGHLIVSHPAAELMEVIDSIRASSSGTFESRIQRSTGSQTLTWTENVDAKAGTRSQPLEVPKEVTFRVAPFEDYPEVDITCWLRLRIRGGSLGMALVPQPYEHRIQASWVDVVDQIAAAIEHPIYAANL